MPCHAAPNPRCPTVPTAVAALAVLAAGCSPALETPPLGPDAASPGRQVDAGADDAGRGMGDGDAGSAREPDGALLLPIDAGPPCSAGDVRPCDCGGLRDDGSPIPGLQLCVAGAFDTCRCESPDGGPADAGAPSCGANGYTGTLTGTLVFGGLGPSEVRPRATVTAVALTLLPVGSDGRREVSGSLRATVGGLADLDGELRGFLSCQANPPTLSTLATAGFTWLGTPYTLQGEFTANLTAGVFDTGDWYLGADGGTGPAADGQGTWSAFPAAP